MKTNNTSETTDGLEKIQFTLGTLKIWHSQGINHLEIKTLPDKTYLVRGRVFKTFEKLISNENIIGIESPEIIILLEQFENEYFYGKYSTGAMAKYWNNSN
jgi:hypothetical protein